MEVYLKKFGFENIDQANGLVSMYQMFLIVFVKKPYLKDISRVVSRTIAKGKNILVTTMGNKGGICYSFAFKNRIFNILGCHLQHRLEKQVKRNAMSRDLINEMKLQEI